MGRRPAFGNGLLSQSNCLFYNYILYVVVIVKALRYKPAGRGFDSRCHWNFSVT